MLFLYIFFFIVLFSMLFMIRLYVVNQRHTDIINAIYMYQIHQIKLYGKILYKDVDYSDMESFDKTLFRIRDWGYENILPEDKLNIIRPFIKKTSPICFCEKKLYHPCDGMFTTVYFKAYDDVNSDKVIFTVSDAHGNEVIEIVKNNNVYINTFFLNYMCNKLMEERKK